MKKVMLVVLLASLLLPACCHAEKSAALVIVDGLGSEYIYPDSMPSCIDGSPLLVINLTVAGNASARYRLLVPTPETECGNAVIATGYSDASGEMLSYYGATIYDVLRANGFLSIAIMQTGDTSYMIAKPDIIAYEQNNSMYNPCITIQANSESVPAGVQGILAVSPPPQQARNTNPAIAYRQYGDWPLDRAVATVQFLGETYPELKYLLVVNAAGPDMAAHDRGFGSYRQAIEDLGPGLSSLETACRENGVVMIMTADHGMSFKSPGSKGSHASNPASERNESRLVPLLVFQDEPGKRTGISGQESLAPTLLSLMECPDTLTLENGDVLPVSDLNTRYRTEEPEKQEAATPRSTGWPPYLLAATLSAAGLAMAIRLLKGR